MLLSDQLFQIGCDLNPKSNFSMNEASKKMLNVCVELLKNDISRIKHIESSFAFAVKELNKKGYTYFKPDHFSQIK